jgi:hypothetical protein
LDRIEAGITTWPLELIFVMATSILIGKICLTWNNIRVWMRHPAGRKGSAGPGTFQRGENPLLQKPNYWSGARYDDRHRSRSSRNPAAG